MKAFLWGLGFWAAFSTGPLWALSPMQWYNSLVAGTDDPGYKDGAFEQARFNHPSGLAFDDAGSRLFVADRGNNRIRVVDLNRGNLVGTLAGTGEPGHNDGPLLKAALNQPTALAWIPPDRLAVYDAGDQALRLVDLKAGKVTTLAGPGRLGGVWNLAYLRADDSLYFTEPATQKLEKLDLKTHSITAILSGQAQFPHPFALCAAKDRLYISDQTSSVVFEMSAQPSSPSRTMVVLNPVGKGRGILEMACSDKILYALQSGKVPLARVAPSFQPVRLPTAWGFFLEENNPGYDPLLQFEPGVPVGLAVPPGEEHKLFIASPSPERPVVTSVEDYKFGPYAGARSVTQTGVLTDFDYPAAKPPRTFRILVVGDSRVVTAPTVAQGEKGDVLAMDLRSERSLRVHTFPKQLEFLLNTQAVLKGTGNRFEVLALAHPGKPAYLFSYYEVPRLVRKYDVDLVLLLVSPEKEEPYTDYFLKPLTAEGIPAPADDLEYALKPIAQRIPAGAPGHLFECCVQLGLIQTSSPKTTVFPPFAELLQAGNPKIREDLLEMAGRPLGLLGEKLEGIKTASGNTVKFSICYVPSEDGGAASMEDYESFWKDLCVKEGLNLMDLAGPYNALKTSFFPVEEACCHHHYTAYGNQLIAMILQSDLVDQKWIPFKTSGTGKE